MDRTIEQLVVLYLLVPGRNRKQRARSRESVSSSWEATQVGFPLSRTDSPPDSVSANLDFVRRRILPGQIRSYSRLTGGLGIHSLGVGVIT